MQDDVHFPLTMALADKAIYGVESLAELWSLEIPKGDDAMALPWKQEKLALPVLRTVSLEHGVIDELMS